MEDQFILGIRHKGNITAKKLGNILIGLDEIYTNYDPYNMTGKQLEVSTIRRGSTIIDLLGDPVIRDHVAASFLQAKVFFDAYWGAVKGNVFWDVSKVTVTALFSAFVTSKFSNRRNDPSGKLTDSSIAKAIGVLASFEGDSLYIKTDEYTLDFRKNEPIDIKDTYLYQKKYDSPQGYPLLDEQLARLSREELIAVIHELARVIEKDDRGLK